VQGCKQRAEHFDSTAEIVGAQSIRRMSGRAIDDPAALRVFVYDSILSRGAPPSSRDIAAHFGVEPAAALRAIRALNVGKTVLPHPTTGEIWMAGPFASAPTPYTVLGRGVQWWANCAWDMLGVAVVAGQPVRIEARCTDCGEPMVLTVDPSRAFEGEGVVHFLVPARRWYDDIGFT